MRVSGLTQHERYQSAGEAEDIPSVAAGGRPGRTLARKGEATRPFGVMLLILSRTGAADSDRITRGRRRRRHAESMASGLYWRLAGSVSSPSHLLYRLLRLAIAKLLICAGPVVRTWKR